MRANKTALTPLRRPLACLVPLACLSLAAPLPAQTADEDEAEPDTVETRMIDQARHYYGIARDLRGCEEEGPDNAIVICRTRPPDPRYAPPKPRQPPTAKMVALGAPPTGRGVGVGVVVRGCFLQKCPKDLYFIDLKAIPEAPPGSDADRVGQGLLRAD
jgi:hypothetical protein